MAAPSPLLAPVMATTLFRMSSLIIDEEPGLVLVFQPLSHRRLLAGVSLAGRLPATNAEGTHVEPATAPMHSSGA